MIRVFSNKTFPLGSVLQDTYPDTPIDFLEQVQDLPPPWHRGRVPSIELHWYLVKGTKHCCMC